MDSKKYKEDFDELISRGHLLLDAAQIKFIPDETQEMLSNSKTSEYIEKLPCFTSDYQTWYSEALCFLEQLLPSRVNDFVELYKPKRTKATLENFAISDALQGLRIEGRKENFIGRKAFLHLKQQLGIIKSVERKFESSLFDIRHMEQAELFDSELEQARELAKNGFIRAAGIIAGVVLEGHLSEVCSVQKMKTRKKRPGINDFALLLKDKKIITVPTWRNIQYLSDIRNSCAHAKEPKPKKEDIVDLINGVGKIIKTVS